MKRGNKTMKYIFSFSILFLSLLIFTIPLAYSLNTWDTGWSLPQAIITIFVTSAKTCKIVNNPTSINYFVPTKTSQEWSSFVNFASLAGIKIQETCAVCGNGILDSGEECDGNQGVPSCKGTPGRTTCEGSYSCSSSCTVINDCYCDTINDPSEPPVGGGGCFVEGTLVKTSKGNKDISKLSIEEYVLSYDNLTNEFVYSKIEKLLIHEYNTNWYYLIKTENSQVEVTDVHPFYVGDGIYSRIEDLNVGDKIYLNIKGKLVEEEILSKERINLPKLITVYNLELNKDGPRNYFANNYLVHNGDEFLSWNKITGLLNDKMK